MFINAHIHIDSHIDTYNRISTHYSVRIINIYLPTV